MISDRETPVFLALGSNKGDRLEFLRNALKGLERGGFRILKVSSVYETEPVGCYDDSAPYFNAVLEGRWLGDAESLLHLCQSLEQAAGRPLDHAPMVARELDLDLLLFGDQIIQTAHLTIPHPRAAERSFVMVPLYEIAPDLVFPDCGLRVTEIYRSLLPHDGISAALCRIF